MNISDVRAGARCAGTMLRMIRNPAIVPLAQHAGLDFIMLDMEHGSYSSDTASDIFTAASSAGLMAFVRVPELARGYVSRALDCGALGVMVPMIESVEQARAFVQWAKYPPLGGRGLSSVGGHTSYRSEPTGTAFMARENAATLAIAQIETRAAIEAIDGIAAVEGIDVLLIGPNDLAVSLGCADDMAVEMHAQAIRKTALAAQRHGKIFGIHGGLAMIRALAKLGLTFSIHSNDITMLAESMAAVAGNVRSALEQGPQVEQ